MSTEDRKETDEPSTGAGEMGEEELEAAPTPFDHPLFLPVLLAGLTLWFGYDGWLNDDPNMQEHLTFNRVGFGLLLCGAIYYGVQGYREWKEERD
ncbi:MAG: hypothetical protein QF570_00800 [Myxococcota bacterium]|jgi:hypothetical protein|nr:hypothetical protein [Myxococcota bacterium]